MSDKYVPRLDSAGIYQNKYWYSDNPFEWSGYGLPNCTAYAWGRWYELLGFAPSALSTGDGGNWFDHNENVGGYDSGQTPKLGAIACFGSTVGGAGHVAVVEVIDPDGSFVTSNSGYYRPLSTYPPDTPNYFYTATHNAQTKLSSGMGGRYEFQGFIYIPKSYGEPIPMWLFRILTNKRR